jgi:hypothetical protein
MKINETDKPKHASDKYRVINFIIVHTMTSMPCALEADDVTDFCSLAQYYALKTPGSFRKVRCTLISLAVH